MARRNPWYYFNIAAVKAAKSPGRNYMLAALGLRSDGAIVCSANGHPKHPNRDSHAEKRLCRKLDKGASVFVVRVGANGEFRLSRPCALCLFSMKVREVKRIYYTISSTEYGVIDL